MRRVVKSWLAVMAMVAVTSGGCQTLRVKLAVRGFGRALKKGSRRKVMKRSTRDLNQKVWARLAKEEFSDLVDQLAEVLKKRSGSRGKKSAKAGKKTKEGKSRRISVKVKNGTAWLRLIKGKRTAKFDLQKKGGDWKIDDVEIELDGGSLSLKRDFSMYSSARSFFRGAEEGDRQALIRNSSRDFRGALSELSDAMVRQASKTLDFGGDESKKQDGGKEKAKKAKPSYRFKVAEGTARLEMRRGDDLYVLVMSREQGRWLVDDVLATYTSLSGKKKLGSIKALVRAVSSVRDFIRALVRRDIEKLRRLSTDSARKEVWSKISADQVTPIPVPRSPKLVGRDFTRKGATLVLAHGNKRLTAVLRKQVNDYRVQDLILTQGEKTITLNQATAIRHVLIEVIRAGFRGDIDAVRKHSSKDLNERVFSRLQPVSKLKKTLLAGGLDELLGIQVLPKRAFGKVAFLAEIATKLRNVMTGRVRILGAWAGDGAARVTIKLFGRRVRARLVEEQGEWKLDDVSWQINGKYRSFKRVSGFLLE